MPSVTRGPAGEVTREAEGLAGVRTLDAHALRAGGRGSGRAPHGDLDQERGVHARESSRRRPARRVPSNP